MTLNQTRTADILYAIYADLKTWCATLGGTVQLAPTMADMLPMLSDSPGGWRVVMGWRGKINSGQERLSESVSRHELVLMVHSSDPLELDRGLSTIQDTTERDCLIDIAEQVDARMLAMTFDTDTVDRGRLFGLEFRNAEADGVPLSVIEMSYAFRSRAVQASTVTITVGEQDD